MSTITFKAFIDSVHFDPKKGTLKIQLIADSHISIDRLTTLGPGDEYVNVTLQSAQTKITDVGDPIGFKGPDVTKNPREAAERVRDEMDEEKEEEDEAEGDKDEVEEGLEDGLI